MPMFASLVLLLASAPMAAATRGAQPSVSDALAAAHHAEFWPMFDEVAAFLSPVIRAVGLCPPPNARISRPSYTLGT